MSNALPNGQERRVLGLLPIFVVGQAVQVADARKPHLVHAGNVVDVVVHRDCLIFNGGEIVCGVNELEVFFREGG